MQMFDGPLNFLYWALIGAYTIALTIILIKCTVSLMGKGRRNSTMDLSSVRKCTAQDVDLLGGILSESPSKKCDNWVCTICLSDSQGDEEEPEEFRELKVCKHVFHRECIDRWCLDTPLHSLKCPLCRGLVFESQLDPIPHPEPVVQPTFVDRDFGLPGG
jgi:hypothetical protein